MYILVGAASDLGNVKDINQDSFFAKVAVTQIGEVGLIAMCDGMGGLSKGEVASAKAVMNFKAWFDNELEELISRDFSEDIILNTLVDLVNKINKEVIEYAVSISERVGTTVSALLILSGKYYIAHVGDSRIYSIGKKIKQLTEDHTFVAMNVRKGIMTKEEARVSPKRNILTQCIGVEEKLKVYTKVGSLAGKECFLLCSDGLYNTISEEELFRDITKSEKLDSEVLQGVAVALVNKAKGRRERDNISAIIVGIVMEDNKDKPKFLHRLKIMLGLSKKRR